jgi:hypothetical protein
MYQSVCSLSFFKFKLICSEFYLPEFKAWSSRVCGHCEGLNVIVRGRTDVYPTLEPICEHGHIVREIPNTVEALREHIANVHPHLLEGFDLGWAALPTELQERWKLRPTPRITQRWPYRETTVYRAWHSWVAFAFNEIRPKYWAKNMTYDRSHDYNSRNSPNSLNDLAKKATYPGKLLGLPEELEPLGPPAERYRHRSSGCVCLKPPSSFNRNRAVRNLRDFSEALAERVMARQIQISWENKYKELLAQLENDGVTTSSPSEMYGSHCYPKLGRKRDMRYGKKPRTERLSHQEDYWEDQFD